MMVDLLKDTQTWTHVHTFPLCTETKVTKRWDMI